MATAAGAFFLSRPFGDLAKMPRTAEKPPYVALPANRFGDSRPTPTRNCAYTNGIGGPGDKGMAFRRPSQKHRVSAVAPRRPWLLHANRRLGRRHQLHRRQRSAGVAGPGRGHGRRRADGTQLRPAVEQRSRDATAPSAETPLNGRRLQLEWLEASPLTTLEALGGETSDRGSPHGHGCWQ